MVLLPLTGRNSSKGARQKRDVRLNCTGVKTLCRSRNLPAKDFRDKQLQEIHTISWIPWILIMSLPGNRNFLQPLCYLLPLKLWALTSPARICSVLPSTHLSKRSCLPTISCSLSQQAEEKGNLHLRCWAHTSSFGANGLQALCNTVKHPGWISYFQPALGSHRPCR